MKTMKLQKNWKQPEKNSYEIEVAYGKLNLSAWNPTAV